MAAHEDISSSSHKSQTAHQAQTYKQHAESNTLTAHNRNCLLPNPTSMHAPRAPRGILTQNRSTRTATFILLGAHRGLVTLVGEETTQGQHTDLRPCKAQQGNILPWHKPALLQGRNEDLNPYFSDCELDTVPAADYHQGSRTRSVSFLAIFWTLELPLAALLFLTSW